MIKPVNNTLQNCGALILAAGNSSRMGEHKALLLTENNKTFIEKIVSVYALLGCKNIIVVTNRENVHKIKLILRRYRDTTVKVVLNTHPEWGRFYSIKQGLNFMPNLQQCFIHNCDNPYITQHVIMRIFIDSKPNMVNIPIYKRQNGHPILISQEITQSIVKTISNDINLKEYLKQFETNYIKVHSKTTLFNINTPQDLEEARNLVKTVRRIK